MKTFTFSVKQKGYGRQGLYLNYKGEQLYIMDVYPNVKEYFGICSEQDAFYSEENNCWLNNSGEPIEEISIYKDLDDWLSEYLQEECLELIEEYESENEELL